MMTSGDSIELMSALLNFHQADAIHAAARDRYITVLGDVDVAHHTAARGNFPGLEFLGLGIETHHSVGIDPRLAVPDHLVDCGDAVWLRLRSARRSPFGRLAAGGIVPAKISARVVRIPDHVVAGDGDTPRAAFAIRQ